MLGLREKTSARATLAEPLLSTAKSGQRWERLAIYLLIALYIIPAIGYSLATPFNEAPDEVAHLVYIEHLVRYGSLPVIKENPVTHESFQPPLYYLIGAGLVLTVKTLTGDERDKALSTPLRGNPAARTDTNPKAMLYLHPPEVRWPFWPYLLRSISILMGLGCVLLTYAMARVLVPPPSSPAIPFMAGAFAALIPEVTFIHATVTNQVLTDLLAAWVGLLLTIHLLRPYSRSRIVWLGVVLGLGLLTKLSGTLLILPALWVLWIRRDGDWKRLFRDLSLMATVILAVAGWFYIYRWVVYGDPLALAAWHAMLPPDGLFHLSDFFWLKDPFRWFLWSSFWGVFGWQAAWMPEWTYWVYGVLSFLAVCGVLFLVVRRFLTQAQREACLMFLMNLALAYGLVIGASTYLVAWQGREMFTALPSVCVLLALGLGGPVMHAVNGERIPLRRIQQTGLGILAAIVALVLLILNVYALVGVVYPQLSLGM